MPIYQYLCPHCNRIYDFLSRTVTPQREPVCPRCGATDLAKQVSRFAVVRGTGGGDDDGFGGDDGFGPGGDPLADPRAAAEMERLMADAEHIDEGNPRELGRFMRRMTELAGEPIGPEMHEALRRLEAGEDPDRVEDDLGDIMGELPQDGARDGAAVDAAYGAGAEGGDGGDGGIDEAAAAKALRGRPARDGGLYEM
ncbi:MAG: FmdB family zinc ribbon protein [Ardenticatenales bacterium]